VTGGNFNKDGEKTFASLAQQIRNRQRNKFLRKGERPSHKTSPRKPDTQKLPPPPPVPKKIVSRPLVSIAPKKFSSTQKHFKIRKPPLNAVARATRPPPVRKSQKPSSTPKPVQPKKMAKIIPPEATEKTEATVNAPEKSYETQAGVSPEKKRKGPSLNPEQLYAMAQMGYTQWEYGKLDRARAIFQTLVTQRPDEGWFRCALGSIFQKQKQFAQALQQYNIALQLDPNDLSSRVNRGEILLKVGKSFEARTDLAHAVKHDATGKNPSALRARSLLNAMGRQLK